MVEGNEQQRQIIPCSSFIFKAKTTFHHAQPLFTSRTMITLLHSLDISVLFHTNFL